jgi:uncharacterized protein
MEFEWDRKKAENNLRLHGVSFDEAMTVFDDPLFLTFADPDHSEEEQRFIIMGKSSNGKLLVVAHTKRSQVTRLISARKATRKERKSYEEDI